MILADVEERCSWMDAGTRQRTVEWARQTLQLLGDQWALRTWGPATDEIPPDLDVGPVTVREWQSQKIMRDLWAEYPDTVKAVYNCCGGDPQAPLPEHGVISQPWWWS
jgi:hypothetical protein